MNQIPNIEEEQAKKELKIRLHQIPHPADRAKLRQAINKVLTAQNKNHHHQLQKALTCGKDMGDGSICGCKLDCHLHDWRQREEIQKAREEAVDELLTDIDFSYLLKEQERGEFGHVTSELERLAFKYRI